MCNMCKKQESHLDRVAVVSVLQVFPHFRELQGRCQLTYYLTQAMSRLYSFVLLQVTFSWLQSLIFSYRVFGCYLGQ